jgi:hypothetical protein
MKERCAAWVMEMNSSPYGLLTLYSDFAREAFHRHLERFVKIIGGKCRLIA